MCGIFGLINLTNQKQATSIITRATSEIDHRGPDDEGFLLWDYEHGSKIFAGKLTNKESRRLHNLDVLNNQNWLLALGHKRLSILDLSTAGHQPMILKDAGLSISFNGEIYNYLEIRDELIKLGHHFSTGTDTEVILHAWQAWGEASLQKFNGMFAFLLLDELNQQLFAVRDRFGVKPLYYYTDHQFLALASEVKQIRTLPTYSFSLDRQNTFDYLLNGSVDHNEGTFEKDIKQLKGGQLMRVPLGNPGEYKISNWYTLKPKQFQGTDGQAFDTFHELLKDSVRLRMRSDVTVGSCLSGGLDSSTIVCLMRDVLGPGKEIKTVTSCFEDPRFDEWHFANEVVEYANATPYRIFPTFEKLQTDLDRFIHHMDYPFGSTSQFSQWNVFQGAAEAGLKVMIDGQGADEQLAGYGGNDMALYTGLLKKLHILELIKEILAYKKYKGSYPLGFLIGAVQFNLPESFLGLFPDSVKIKKDNSPAWLNAVDVDNKRAKPANLNSWLKQQVLVGPLPSLLRYEDRNSMAFSIESRVPFMDYRLVEFTLGLRENLVYRKGERKYVLRQAFKGKVPEKVLARKDKMGFVSPEEVWFKEKAYSWFENMAYNMPEETASFVNKKSLEVYFNEIRLGKRAFDFVPWRLTCLNAWIKQHAG